MSRISEPRTATTSVPVPQRSRHTRIVGQSRGLVPILAFLVLWELVARAGIFPPVLFPSFLTVVRQLVTLTVQGELLADIAISAFRAVAGLALATAMGVTVGLAMARARLANWFFEPLIAIGFPMPKIALIPVFILWFGIGHESKILLVALTCFFPIALSTAAGAREVNQHLIWSAQAMGTANHRVFWRIILPAALPFILSGIRTTLPVSLIVAFVAEMVGGGGGLGYALVFGYRFLETPTVFAVLLTVLALGFLLDRVLLYVRASLLPWDEE
jgi:ABC-type nitrate/sulfonate/bicarbonate transport system permease component